MIFSSKRSSAQTIALFEIGSDSVGGTLVSIEPGKSPVMLYGTRTRMVFEQDPESKRLKSSMLSALSQTAASLERAGLSNLKESGHPMVSEVVCVLSSPWYAGRTKVISISKKEPYTITKAMIESLIGKEEENLLNPKVARYEDDIAENLKVIERRLVKAMLNGYETASPYGKAARTLELSFFISVVEKKLALQIEGAIGRIFNAKIVFHSFPLMSSTITHEHLSNRNDFLLLDIGGEITDVTLMKGGVAFFNASFPFGRNHMIRRLAEDLRTTPQEALSMLTIMKEKQIDAKITDDIHRSLEAAALIWSNACRSLLLAAAQNHELPKTIAFLSGPSVESFIKNALAALVIDPILAPPGGFQIHEMNETSLIDYCVNKTGQALDVRLVLAALFLRRGKEMST